MSYLKFKHLFAALMAIAAIMAFVVPQRVVQARVPGLELLFVPMSWPSASISRWAHDRIAPAANPDQRAADVVKRENQDLKNQLSAMHELLAKIQRLEEYRKEIGDIRPLCTPCAVVAGDSGTRQTLAIAASSVQGLREGMAVLFPGGIVGQVQRAGVAGTRVRLVTDAGFRVRVGFARFEGTRYLRVPGPEGLVEGTGRGAMQIRGLTREIVKSAGLKTGDIVILGEPTWPGYLQGWVLGRITSIGSRSDAPLFAQIVVEPTQNLMQLTEVMVVTKQWADIRTEAGE